MPTVTVPRRVDPTRLPWPCQVVYDGTTSTVVAEQAPDDQTLLDAIDATPDLTARVEIARDKARKGWQQLKALRDFDPADLVPMTEQERWVWLVGRLSLLARAVMWLAVLALRDLAELADDLEPEPPA